jgi:3-hydroxymyristoyl/3-hydroxydecanoyl-(acyl carrier protein) dehydratase
MAETDQELMGIFKGIEKATFEQPVRPEDTLELGIDIVDRGKRDFKGQGIVKVSGQVACQTTITGLIIPRRMALRLLGSTGA